MLFKSSLSPSLLFIVLFTFLFTHLNAQDYKFEWLKTLEGVEQEFVRGMQSDSYGNVYLYGNFKDSLSIGEQTIYSKGDFDFFLVKYNSNGNVDWMRNSGGNFYDNVTSLDIDSEGNVYIVGNFTYSIALNDDTLIANSYLDNFLIKYSPIGDVIYSKNIGASSKTNEVFIRVLKDDNIIVASSFYNKLYFDGIILTSQGNSDIYILKLDFLGNLIDYKQIGGNGKIKLNDFVVDDKDNLYLAGYFTESINFYNKEYKSAGKRDAFLFKLSSDFNPVWDKHIECIFNAETSKILINPLGDVSISGVFREDVLIEKKTYLSSNGSNDIFILDYNKKGKLYNYKNIGGQMNENVHSLIYDKNGSKLISGSFKGELEENGLAIETQNKDNDLFIGKIDLNDEFSDLVKLGGTYQDYISSVNSGLDNCLYITGGFDKDFKIKEDSVVTGNQKDIFLIKFNSCLNEEDTATTTRTKTNNVKQNNQIINDDVLIAEKSNKLFYDINAVKNELEDNKAGNEILDEHVDNLNNITVDILPNPSDGKFIIFLNNFNFNTSLNYEIYNPVGKLILRKTIKSNKEEINLRNTSNGSYLLKVILEDRILNKIIIINK